MLRDEIADQLVYSTVRITGVDNTKKWNGTGFFMIDNNKTETVSIITNRHVVQDADYIKISLVLKNEDGTPNNKSHADIEIYNIQDYCIFHPDSAIDLCRIRIADYLSELGYSVYYKCIPTTMIASPSGLESLTSIEDVIMIGYPNAIMDSDNLKPVVRSGITATDLKNDYNGKPEFLIDIACFPGSSGSPVFLRKPGLEKEQISNNEISIAIKPNYAFLGVLYAGPTISIDGNIVVKDIPTKAMPVAEMKTMMNLGLVIKESKVLELF